MNPSCTRCCDGGLLSSGPLVFCCCPKGQQEQARHEARPSDPLWTRALTAPEQALLTRLRTAPKGVSGQEIEVLEAGNLFVLQARGLAVFDAEDLTWHATVTRSFREAA